MSRFFLPDTVVRFLDPVTRQPHTGTIIRLRCGPIDTYDIDVGGSIRVIAVSAVRPA